MLNKVSKLLLNMIPVLLMIALIPLILNDYLLAGAYILIIIISLLIKYEKKDYLFLIFGLVIMTFFEFIFISTGVENFTRNSLFGMPIWLPILWAYGFIAIKRAIKILAL